MEIVLFFAALLLCYSNGANDNFKGFATVWGSQSLSYEAAIRWASVTTVAGAITGLYFAEALVANFSGRGLVPDALAGTTPFILSVALGAGCTVMLATLLGFPISTTHALIGGLVGAGLAAPVGGVNFGKLGQTFVLPLLASPVLAAAAAGGLYFAARRLFPRSFQTQTLVDACVCESAVPLSAGVHGVALGAVQMRPIAMALPMVGSNADCAQAGVRPLASVRMTGQAVLQKLHYLSAAAICFARGVNDTPKLVALLLAAKLVAMTSAFWVVAVAMALGGWFNARKVATTMAKKIVPLTETQGVTANVVTAFLVIFASKLGLPVSTTHVSVGSISGVGIATGKLDFSELSKIVLSWVVTLPCAASIAAVTMFFISAT